MKIIVSVENDNPFNAGWLACHMGFNEESVDFLLDHLTQMQREVFKDGWKMREETADMNDSRQDRGHGRCHIAFLCEATDPKINIEGRHVLNISLEKGNPS